MGLETSLETPSLVPICIVWLLISLYRQQTMQVKWGTSFLAPLTVTTWVEEVKGEFWTHIFLLCTLNSQTTWVQPRVGNMVVDHLMFAGDLCIQLQEANSGLQCLLDICGDYAAEHEIAFKCNKTIVFPFWPQNLYTPAPSNFFLDWIVYMRNFLAK